MARKTQAQRDSEALDKQIESLYYKLASGRQINIMKIGALFKDAKTSHLSGSDLETAVKAAIETHCDPVA